MMNFLLVFIGGGTGATLRYLVSIGTAAALRPYTHNAEGMPHEDVFIGLIPVATLAVNVLGCFLIGLAIPLITGREELRLLLIVGVLGGFTTYSAFGYETIALHHNNHTILAAGYVAATVVTGIVAVLLGHLLATKMAA